MKKINEITSSDKSVDVVARIEKVILSTGSNGQNYMIINLADKTGRVEARKWLVTEKDKEVIKPNEIIKIVNAAANEFRNQLQVKINDYIILDEEGMKKEGVTFEDFFVTAPLNIDAEYEKLITLINTFNNNDLKEITLKILKDNEEKFKTYPAAMSIHHNVQGGLFWHSWTLVKDVLSIKPNYAYANIDWELLVSGAILHDIGKVIEMNDVTATDYSLEGKLLGHISIGNALVSEAAKDLNIYYKADGTINENVTLLEHMILASHGKNEYGSPVEPLIIEAIILSTFDNLDARIYKTNDELGKINVNEWTQRIPSEDNKFFFKHKDKK